MERRTESSHNEGNHNPSASPQKLVGMKSCRCHEGDNEDDGSHHGGVIVVVFDLGLSHFRC